VRLANTESVKILLTGITNPHSYSQALMLSKAMKLIVLGEPLSGTEAHSLGLVCSLTEPGQALQSALGLAMKLGSRSQSAIMLAKEAICRGSYSYWILGQIALFVLVYPKLTVGFSS
jgi:enoyl-CoA hydratase/carnithine racemase